MNKQKSSEEVKRVLDIARKHPNKARGAFLAKAVQGQFTEVEIDAAKSKVVERLNKVEKLLADSQSGFIFGNRYSMADSVVTALLCRLQRLSFFEIINQYKLVSSYYERMKKRPSFLQARVS
jgi:glutathione S-transferase